MSLFGVMRTGVSGMNAQSNKLSTVSDNIANVNTTGYKRASTEFSSLILKSGSGSYDSGAVETHVRYAISNQGHLQFTTSSTDLAVQGNGFFVVQDNSGAKFFTRQGTFLPDNQGNLVNLSGFHLLGYPGGASVTPTNSLNGLQLINVNQATLQAQPSTTAAVDANLDPSAPVVLGPVGPANFTSKSSTVAFDSIGRPVTIDTFMLHTATAAGSDSWQIQAFSAGVPLAPSQTFIFDTTVAGKGTLAVASPTTLNFTVPGGSAFVMDLSKMTQVASNFTFKATVDGNAPAAVEKVEVDETGLVSAVLTNGTVLPTFRIPLADFPARDSLTPEVGNVYSVSLKSGNPQLGTAGSQGLGSIQSEALEESNVDLGDELTAMIESQRSFTANSKSFQTGADLLDVVVNLKR
jgi:flagellar hook protein FlgE